MASDYTPTPLEHLQPQKERWPLPDPNPVTRQAHRREVFWQITVPFLVSIILVGLAAFGLYSGQVAEVERWAHISTILMLLPLFVFSFILLILIIGLIYLVTYLLGVLPPYARMSQDIIHQIGKQLESSADLVVEPLLKAESYLAMLKSLFKKK
jgi:hypothetical protein